MTIAPEQAGIGIRRHFTTPGVHPYEQVAWERRDARISNFRDGTVAFEQRDVEFPVGWSQNATNIVAQKYFRGPLGAPERERSLKSVLDRVVDTIARWGVKDGYFVDQAEAETFRAELKHVLVHQKAAFNSPVWFNIGVEGEPQQASACQPWSAPVNTPGGPVPIGRLVDTAAVGTKVFDAQGLTKVLAVKANGRKPVLRINTKVGFSLDLTPDHLVWLVTGTRTGCWVEAGTLRPGHLLEWHRDERWGTTGVASVEHLGDDDVYDIQTESGEYLSAGLRVHNCFILAVDDTMKSILNWYVEEGTIFKGGSGSGINLSRIRSSKEQLKGGGTASGPVSFMRGADASAGTIKSAGKTRRAAKMVVLNADHPDIEDFIWCKSIEERKARVLRDAGFDMDLDGKDSHSLQYQNANNSVRVTDEFMQAVVDDADWHLRAVTTGEPLRTLKARDLFRQIAQAAWECADPGLQFDTTINRWHTAPNTGPITASNPCSEYMHIDNSACNLASLNLLKFLDDQGNFDVEGFKAAVEVVFTAQEILVGNADYPTEKIAENSRRFRQLGLGYANLGAMLMALGLPYDSDEGRAWAAAITSLMTGHAYATSGRTAARMGPFAGYTENREPMNRVLRMHRDEVATIDEELVPTDLLSSAQEAWDLAVDTAELCGVRNAQASVLAPTGCLVGGSLVPTDRGLVRLRSLGDVQGPQWQDLDVTVSTDEGPRPATRFYVNGLEPVVNVKTVRGYRVRGTAAHQVKVVDAATGMWRWRRLGDLRPGDVVPLALDQLLGEPQAVALPASARLGDDPGFSPPLTMTPALAELVGFFMSRGERSDDGLRFVVPVDFDMADHVGRLAKELFGVAGRVAVDAAAATVTIASPALSAWWAQVGFDGRNGHVPHLPDAVLAANDRHVYTAFLRGFADATGSSEAVIASWVTSSIEFSCELQTLLLALGYPTSRKLDASRSVEQPEAVVRLLDGVSTERWREEAATPSSGRSTAADTTEAVLRKDRIPVPRALVKRLTEGGDRMSMVAAIEGRNGSLSRRLATQLFERTGDLELGHLLSFFFDPVVSAELTEEEFTYDLSVPDNVTYIANGFVSHNTIGLMMDCDTTGIEPDLGLCKTKKLVGGGNMSIVNQTIPRALRRLGYSAEQITEIVAYIDEQKSIFGAPHLSTDHLAVFACSMGDNVIHHLGHIRMMAAVQPWISGAISKCITADSLLATADGLVRIGDLYEGERPDSFRPEIREVASLDGTQKTDAFYYGGLRPVRRAQLRSGHQITGTPNHRVLTATPSGLDWRRLDEIEPGEHVAVQYGTELWSPLPARFDGFSPSKPYGCQKTVPIPAEMTEELAFLLGAYASEGHVNRSNWTVVVTNSVDAVLERVKAAWRTELGVEAQIVRQPGKCPGVVVASKTVVEFLSYLGCGSGASSKRIPDAVLRSPRSMVLSFLQGLSLDAYVTVATAPKWGICLDASALLDDLQAVLTNLGIVHSRITKFNKDNAKSYGEVYATGAHAQRLACLVPFLEPDKARRGEALCALSISASHNTADIVPGLAPLDLYRLVPYRTRNAAGVLLRTEFNFLHDPRTRHVSRRALERVAALPGVELPPSLRTILDDNLHFSPVKSVGDAGTVEVFDVSVPVTQAFVANGIVNHNTVNTPETATVDEIEQLHIDAWRLGLKAVAIYRDNCKVAQPLAMTKKAGAIAAASADITRAADELEQLARQPIREKLPRKRNSKTFSFRVADCHGYVTVGQYDDGRPGEIFLRVAKQGSTLAGVMDAFAISVSHGLQYGVPLKAFVEMFTSMRFEPAGMTDDPELRIASSLVDYIFRRLAVEYLPFDDRAELGILTVAERIQPTLPGVEELSTPTSTGSEVVPDPAPPVAVARPVLEPIAADAPYCYQCGNVMQRAGSCYVCGSCGTTSGCS